jgi:hypothetical protein
MAKKKSNAGRNSGGNRSKAKNTRNPAKNRGPGKSYQIVSEAGAMREMQGKGFFVGGVFDHPRGPAYIGGANESFNKPAPKKKYPGGTNRSRPTRTPASLTDNYRFIMPDRPDGTGNRADQRRIPGPWPGGPGTRVRYRGTAFWGR